MQNALVYIVLALGISILVNIFLKRVGISQIIGYILTGTIIVYAFDLREIGNSHSLELVGEFGIVFLMFTIGLEISLAKMGCMKKEIFGNGSLQVGLTTLVTYFINIYFFNFDAKTSIIIALAFSLSSTAVVLSYLKASKEIHSPYGQKSTGILIFQDIAVIPILILIGFLTSEANESVWVILSDTFISALVVLILLFVVGKKIMTWLLHFSASSGLEELFMGSVLFIVITASLWAHYMGFTYSLGAFVAGMIIAETRYHHKVEADIAPFKDILLGTFFVVVGMKIDINMFISNIGLIVGLFLAVLVLKTAIIYILMRLSSAHAVSLKTALALSQIGEFSFVIFAVASMGNIIDEEIVNFLVLVVIFSMIVTPFIISKINIIVEYFTKEDSIAPEIISLDKKSNHIVVCGYSVIGKFVAKSLDDLKMSYVIIDNSPKHVIEAINDGREAYLGDMSKLSILDALQVENASGVIVTLDNIDKKRLICEAVLTHTQDVNLVVKVVSLEEKEKLEDLDINVIVDGKLEVAKVLVKSMLTCRLNPNCIIKNSIYER